MYYRGGGGCWMSPTSLKITANLDLSWVCLPFRHLGAASVCAGKVNCFMVSSRWHPMTSYITCLTVQCICVCSLPFDLIPSILLWLDTLPSDITPLWSVYFLLPWWDRIFLIIQMNYLIPSSRVFLPNISRFPSSIMKILQQTCLGSDLVLSLTSCITLAKWLNPLYLCLFICKIKTTTAISWYRCWKN